MTQFTAYEYLVAIVTKVNTNACIVWPFYIDKGGYGQVRIPSFIPGEKTGFLVHRAAYKIAYGEWPMPKGLHSCDNRRCFNPRHIFPGTPRDNTDDMVAKDRQAKGERTALSKLTCALVQQARREYAEGITSGQLATRYGVSVNVMCAALSGETWKHVSNPIKMRIWRKPLATHCLHGHLFVEESFYATLLPSGITHRQCKICTKNRYEIRKLQEYLERGR